MTGGCAPLHLRENEVRQINSLKPSREIYKLSLKVQPIRPSIFRDLKLQTKKSYRIIILTFKILIPWTIWYNVKELSFLQSQPKIVNVRLLVILAYTTFTEDIYLKFPKMIY